MTEIEKMRQFLLTYPGWDGGKLLYIDYTDGVPGGCGLFPAGREELSRREDVLGNVAVDCRLNFALYRVGAGQDRAEADALWLMDFQAWVQAQSLLGLAPKFGDLPQRERLVAKQGKLTKGNRGEGSLYAVQLSAEFTKYYEVKKDGEN